MTDQFLTIFHPALQVFDFDLLHKQQKNDRPISRFFGVYNILVKKYSWGSVEVNSPIVSTSYIRQSILKEPRTSKPRAEKAQKTMISANEFNDSMLEFFQKRDAEYEQLTQAFQQIFEQVHGMYFITFNMFLLIQRLTKEKEGKTLLTDEKINIEHTSKKNN